MIKSALIVVGVIVLLFVAYVGWVLYRAGSTIDIRPLAQAAVLSDKIQVTVTFVGADTEHQITEAIFPRELGESLGIGAPTGLTPTPYTIDDTGDPSSKESARWVEDSNRENLRWVGSVALRPDRSTILDFPIVDIVAGEGIFRFQYERKLGMGGQISFFDVSIILTKEKSAALPQKGE